MSFIRRYVLPYAKAHVAAWGAAIAMVSADLNAGTGHVSTAQWEAAALVALGLGSAVAVVANKAFADVAAAPTVPAKAVAAVADVVNDVVPVVLQDVAPSAPAA